MRGKIIIAIAFFSVFLSACHYEFPRHQCNSLKEIENGIDFDIRIPSFVESINRKQYNINYYTTAVPILNGVKTTGYSIILDYTGEEDRDYKTIEIRGVNLSRAGMTSEDYYKNIYTCLINDTPIESNGRKLFYSTYRETNYSDKTKSNDIIDNFSRLAESFDYFYMYFMNDDIRYSITFSHFAFPRNSVILDICIKKAISYFKNFDLLEWY